MASTIPMVHVMSLAVLVGGIAVWPRWMTLMRNLLSNRVYLMVSRYLKFSEMRGIFSGIFYMAYAAALAVVLVLLVPEAPYGVYLRLERWYQSPLAFVIETLVIFLASVSIVFVVSNVIFMTHPQLRVTPQSYEDSWLDIYLRIPSRKILVVSALFPVVSEEILFRLVTTVILLDGLRSFLSVADASILPKVVIISPLVLATSMLSTLVFCFQQAVFLKTKEQMLTVLSGALAIGIVNSMALLLGASILSLIIVHAVYLLFFIMQQVNMKEMQQSAVRMAPT